jgi:hypothetical protein
VVLVVVLVVVDVVVLVVVLVVVDVVVLVVVDVVVLVVVEVVVLVVVDVVVLVVVVVIETAIVLLIRNGLMNPSSSTPFPNTPDVAVPTMLGIVHGNGPHTPPPGWQSVGRNLHIAPLSEQIPKTTVLSCAGTATSVTIFVHKGGDGGIGGLPVGPGQQKSAVTCKVLHPT